MTEPETQFRFSVAEGQVEDDLSTEEVIGQAIGAASMCWNPPPAGEFDSTRARMIVDRAAMLLAGVPVTGLWIHKHFPHLNDGQLNVYVEHHGKWHHVQQHDHPDAGPISHITEVAGLQNAPVWDPDEASEPDWWTKGPGTPEQISKLGQFLMENFRDEIGAAGDSESAVDMAIRLLTNRRNVIDYLREQQAAGYALVNASKVINGLRRWGMDGH